MGLISNFTYAPVIYKSLRKVGINEFFNVVVVSEEVGWRKPSSHIFQDALNRLQIQACEAVYIGDSPNEDIKGAKAGRTKNRVCALTIQQPKRPPESKQEPDFIAEDLQTIIENLAEILTLNQNEDKK